MGDTISNRNGFIGVVENNGIGDSKDDDNNTDMLDVTILSHSGTIIRNRMRTELRGV